jgi:hypothetical protein
MRIKLAVPDRLLSPSILEAALEAVTRANQASFRRGEIPGIEEAIRDGVRWRPEAFTDGEHFDLAAKVARRGWGDCDDLAPWLAAEMREAGIPAKTRVRKSGPGRYHVVVQDGDGRIHDPSRWAGMGRRVSGVHGARVRRVCGAGDAQISCVPHRGQWWTRTDIPSPWTPRGHMASIARSYDPAAALAASVSGALDLADAMGLDASDLDDLASGLMGESEVGFLPILGPALSAVTSMFGGGGGDKKPPPPPPPAAPPPQLAAQTLPPGREGGPRTTIMYHPAGLPGPVVARLH